jgi:hypothetical protein
MELIRMKIGGKHYTKDLKLKIISAIEKGGSPSDICLLPTSF